MVFFLMMIAGEIQPTESNVLYEVAKPVEDFEEARKDIEKIKAFCATKGNVGGLAAPQMGISKRIILFIPSRDVDELTIAINPEISERSTEQQTTWEGCFSVPGYFGKVQHSARLTYRYQDINGKWCGPFVLKGTTDPQAIKDMTEEQKKHNADELFHAQVVDHEINHLNGKLYVTYLIKDPIMLHKDMSASQIKDLLEARAEPLKEGDNLDDKVFVREDDFRAFQKAQAAKQSKP